MAKLVAYVFGAVLAVVGVWGFVQNPVLNLFAVNTLHTIVHLVSGLVLLAVAWRTPGKIAWTLVALGVVYAAVVVLQLAAPDVATSLLNSNANDLWLHAALAVVFVAVGVMGRGSSAPAALESSM